MTWDDLKQRHARATAKELEMLECLLDFIHDRRETKQSGRIEFHADQNGNVSKATRIEQIQV